MGKDKHHITDKQKEAKEAINIIAKMKAHDSETALQAMKKKVVSIIWNSTYRRRRRSRCRLKRQRQILRLRVYVQTAKECLGMDLKHWRLVAQVAEAEVTELKGVLPWLKSKDLKPLSSHSKGTTTFSYLMLHKCISWGFRHTRREWLSFVCWCSNLSIVKIGVLIKCEHLNRLSMSYMHVKYDKCC